MRLLFQLNTVTVYRAAGELKNEAKAHVLNHVNVVTFYAMVFERGHYGVVLEFVPHGCLEEYIDKNKVIFNLIKCARVICIYRVVMNIKQCTHKRHKPF